MRLVAFMYQRLLIRIIAPLIGGIAVNVVVALACTFAAWQFPGNVVRPTSEERELVSSYHSLERHDLTFAGSGGHLQRSGYSEFMIQSLAAWENDQDSDGLKVILDVRAGWPIKSFTAAAVRELDTDSRTWRRQNRHLVIAPHVASTETPGEYLFPTRPIWRGFIINSLIYAIALWLVFFMPGLLRRRIRTRRGLCPTCAYPVGTHDRCTECGHSLSRAAQLRGTSVSSSQS